MLLRPPDSEPIMRHDALQQDLLEAILKALPRAELLRIGSELADANEELRRSPRPEIAPSRQELIMAAAGHKGPWLVASLPLGLLVALVNAFGGYLPTEWQTPALVYAALVGAMWFGLACGLRWGHDAGAEEELQWHIRYPPGAEYAALVMLRELKGRPVPTARSRGRPKGKYTDDDDARRDLVTRYRSLLDRGVSRPVAGQLLQRNFRTIERWPEFRDFEPD